MVGRVEVGGLSPIVVQSMTNTDTADVDATVAQVAALAQAGSELVRLTVDRDEAAAALRSAEEALHITQTGARSEDLQAARANLQAGEATLSLSERRLEDTELSAPKDGVILTRVREPGAIIGAGQTVYTLSLISPVWVRTYVIEPDLGRISPGMPAEVHTDGGRTYAGQIGFISPVAEFTPKTVETRELRTSLVYRLRIIVENADDGLRQGMPVTVILHPDETG